MSRLLLIATITLLLPTAAFGDGDGGSTQENQPRMPQSQSNASFDRRLPPVIPGETLPDGDGDSKVWSTAGSPVDSGVVPNPPQPPQAPVAPGEVSNSGLPPNLGIIVEQNERERGFRR